MAGLDEYDASIAPLRAAYQQQAEQGPTGIFANVDPVMLGLAQGFLSPTKSGGFGESIGLGLAGAQAPLEAIRKRQLTAQEKLAELEMARAKMAMEAPYREALAEYYRSGGSRGGGTGGSLSSQSVTLNRAWNLLNNSDPEDLGMTDEEYALAKKNVGTQLIELAKKGGGGKSLAGVATGTDEQPESPADLGGAFPTVKDKAGYDKLEPGTVFTYGGKQYTKPSNPNAPKG